MFVIHHLIAASVRHRLFVVLGVLAFVVIGFWSLQRMTFDAYPDLTNVQVQVLTSSPGMASEEVEFLITLPIERALSSVPGVEELRSMSRTGISAITVVFEDGTDIWHARQLVKEQLDSAREEIPDSAGQPEIGPNTTGLGEVFQFTVSSDRHNPNELYRIFERDIAPRLLTVPGIVEVSAWGGGAPQLEALLDPFALAAHAITIEQVHDALNAAIGTESGGARVYGAEQTLIRAISNPDTVDQLGAIVIHQDDHHTVRLRDVARVQEGGQLTVGLGSANGKGEALFVAVQLLADADALSTVRLVRERTDQIIESLPDGISIEVVYDREKLVGSTLKTVTFSLVEGGLLVIIILFFLLGDWRAGLIVASVIPLSMLGAFTGMAALGYSGNLMSLGAIDFGLIVDATIVVTESIIALQLAKNGHLGDAVIERAQRVAKPVLFATGILILVYIPILTMWGVEGKLFRPMALTVILALVTALTLTFTYVPAMASWFIQPRGEHQTRAATLLLKAYNPALTSALRRPFFPSLIAAATFALSLALATNMGLEFVPQLQEGDLVLQTERLPSISPQQALAEATRIETILSQFPEVQSVASRTGSPALATDPMGIEQADIFIHLNPRKTWTTASTTEGLIEAMAERLHTEAPGAQLSFTQPIEMRFNELLEGITGDVGIKIYGPDLDTLLELAHTIGRELEQIEGTADLSLPAIEGVPGLDVIIDHDRLAAHGLKASDVLNLIRGIQRGSEVGTVQRGLFQDAVVARLDLHDDLPLSDIPLVLPSGRAIPLSEVAHIRAIQTPVTIDRDNGSRRMVVEANVRGRDLGSYVREANQRIAAIDLPDGYYISWSGKHEQLVEAATNVAIILPIILFLIIALLYFAFKSFKAAMLIFLNIPIAISGGVIILFLRDMPISMSAIVGFIALSGIAVMNGIVLLTRTQELHHDPQNPISAARAALQSAQERFRPVLTTAAVAGLGFIPMALATGTGAEVQRPLATVVISGLITSTLLTLVVLPTLYALIFKQDDPQP